MCAQRIKLGCCFFGKLFLNLVMFFSAVSDNGAVRDKGNPGLGWNASSCGHYFLNCVCVSSFVLGDGSVREVVRDR